MVDFIDSKSGKVAYIYNRISNSNTVVILTHGFKSDKNSRTCNALSEKLNKANISTISFDLYGHGQSEGNIEELTITKAVDNSLAIYDFVKLKNYSKIAMSGSSLSGMISLILATKRKLDALALKCPVFDYKKLWDSRIREKGLEQWEKNSYIEIFKTKVSFEAYKDASKYNMQKIAKSINNPTIIIHGNRDITVPISQAEELVSLLSGERKLIIVNGADHFFLLPEHFEKMINESTNWLLNYLK